MASSEKEKCIWRELLYLRYWWKSSCEEEEFFDSLYESPSGKGWIYCPFCGREIKVVCDE